MWAGPFGGASGSAESNHAFSSLLGSRPPAVSAWVCVLISTLLHPDPCPWASLQALLSGPLSLPEIPENQAHLRGKLPETSHTAAHHSSTLGPADGPCWYTDEAPAPWTHENANSNVVPVCTWVVFWEDLVCCPRNRIHTWPAFSEMGEVL